MSDRDAKKFPMSGDVFQLNESRVELIYCGVTSLHFRFEGMAEDCPPMVPWDKPWLPGFLKWAQQPGVTVITRGDEKSEEKS